MRKTLIVISFFVLFLFPHPTYAAENDGFFASIFSFFAGIAGYAAKDPQPTLVDTPQIKKENFTTYSKDKTNPNDLTTRSINDKPRTYNKGKHIEDIILNTYSDPSSPDINERDDKIMASACNHSCVDTNQATSDCRPIRTSEIAYFFLTQNDSTSYTLNQNILTKIPYSSQIKSRLNNKYIKYDETGKIIWKIELVDYQCYYKLYDQITVTPKSNESGQAAKNTGVSEQLNSVEKTFVTQKEGVKEAPSLGFFDWVANVFDGGNTKKLKDNLYKERVFLTDFTPDKQVKTVQFDDSNKNIRTTFNGMMQPASWQNSQPPDSTDTSIIYSPNYPTNIIPFTSPTGVQLYVFEPTSGGGRLTTIYDLGLVDPSKLADIPSQYKASDASNTQLDSRVIPAYTAMIQAARAAGIPADELNLISGYRSIAQQQILWNQSDKTGTYVARPGGSPHHTGRAIDIVVNGGTTNSGSIENQKNSATFRWLQSNAATYGFYNYPVEPWHWEYNPKAP